MELIESYRDGQPVSGVKQDPNSKPITSRRERKENNFKRKLTVLKEELDESEKNEESKEIGYQDDSIQYSNAAPQISHQYSSSMVGSHLKKYPKQKSSQIKVRQRVPSPKVKIENDFDEDDD